jgi:hypothetical protein
VSLYQGCFQYIIYYYHYFCIFYSFIQKSFHIIQVHLYWHENKIEKTKNVCVQHWQQIYAMLVVYIHSFPMTEDLYTYETCHCMETYKFL